MTMTNEIRELNDAELDAVSGGDGAFGFINFSEAAMAGATTGAKDGVSIYCDTVAHPNDLHGGCTFN